MTLYSFTIIASCKLSESEGGLTGGVNTVHRLALLDVFLMHFLVVSSFSIQPSFVFLPLSLPFTLLFSLCFSLFFSFSINKLMKVIVH